MTIDISTADNKNHWILRATELKISSDDRTYIETWDRDGLKGQGLFTDQTRFDVEVS